MKTKIVALGLVAFASLMVIFNGIDGSSTQNTVQAASNNEGTPTGDFNPAFSNQSFVGPNKKGNNMTGFVKIPDAPGESNDPNHKNEIKITSFQQGMTNTPGAPGSGGGAGKAVVDEITFEHELDSSSVKLMTLVANGKHLPSVTFTFRRGNQEVYFVTLTDVQVTKVKQNIGGDSGENNQGSYLEEVDLRFSKIEWKYFPVSANGSLGTPVIGSYNLLTLSTNGN